MTQTQETSAPVTQVVIATPAPQPPRGTGHEFLGRPEPFDGVTARWKDWSVVCQTYLGETFGPPCASLLAMGEQARCTDLTQDSSASAVSDLVLRLLFRERPRRGASFLSLASGCFHAWLCSSRSADEGGGLTSRGVGERRVRVGDSSASLPMCSVLVVTTTGKALDSA